MKYDDFLKYLFRFSSLSTNTKKVYMQYITRCCVWNKKPHILDLTHDDLDHYRFYLLNVNGISVKTDTIIFNAFKHALTVLLPKIDAEAAQGYASYFTSIPRQPHGLPEAISKRDIYKFMGLLPNTLVGVVLCEIYKTSQPFEVVVRNYKCSKQYASRVCSMTARKAGLWKRLGLTGLRATSILHRLQDAETPGAIVQIYKDCGLSYLQFSRYCQAAGVAITNQLKEV